MPRVEPLKIERPRYSQYSGFTRPSAFTYQGPRNFTRPGPAFFPRPPEAPDRSAGSTRRAPATPQSSVGLPAVDTVRMGASERVGPSYSRQSRTLYRDPFSTRYPIDQVTHTVVSNDGTIRTFTTTRPSDGYGRSYDRRHRGPWDLFRYDNGRFNARGYLNRYGLYDPFRTMYYQPFSQVYLGVGVGTAEVLYGPSYTVEEHRAANSGVIPGSQPAAAPDQPLSLIEEVMIAFEAGHPEIAIPRIREHLMSNPDDAAAHRILALALLMDKDIPQGLAELAGSYKQDPGLASSPIDLDYFRIRGSALTETTGRVVAYSKRNSAPTGYFAAAVIQQARGEISIARKMLDLAIKAGLDQELSVALSGALSPQPAAAAPVGGTPPQGNPGTAAPNEKPGPR